MKPQSYLKLLGLSLGALLLASSANSALANQSLADTDPIKYYAQLQGISPNYDYGFEVRNAESQWLMEGPTEYVWYGFGKPDEIDGSALRYYVTCTKAKDRNKDDQEFQACLSIQRFSTASEFEPHKFACEEKSSCSFRINYNGDPRTATTWDFLPQPDNHRVLLVDDNSKAAILGKIFKDKVTHIKAEVEFEGGYKPIFDFKLTGLNPMKLLTLEEQKEILEKSKGKDK